MNKLIAIITLLLIYVATSAQTPFKGADYIFYYQMNVGKTDGSLTAPSAWLEVGKDATTKGFRTARVQDTANVTSPVFGLEVYQIKDHKRYYRDLFGWRRLADNLLLGNYLLKSDSTTYYPYWSNPRNYISTELDPVANAKTVRWIPGDGILISNSAAQPLSSNPVATITANNNAALWNANALQGSPISGIMPTTGQFLSYNGSQYVPTSPPISGTVNSVSLALPSAVFDITGSPVTNAGTLTGSFKNQLANLHFSSPNGISGQPSFRALAYPDFPLSGVASGVYGSDTTVPQITVNSQGVVTNAINVPISIPEIIGTPNWLPKYNVTGDGLVNSQIFDNGSNVGVNNSSPIAKLDVTGDLKASSTGNFGVSVSINGATDLPSNFSTVQFKNNNGTRRGYVGDASSNNSDIYLAGLNGSNIRFFGIPDDNIATAPTLKALFTNAGRYVIHDTVITGTATFRVNGSAQVDTLSIGLATPTERLHINGNIIAAAPAYLSGGFTPVVRNNTTGRFETGSVGGSGTVTSVALAVPGEFSVSGSPVTTSGTITISKSNQSANTVYAGPASGGAATPAFRAIVRADIPKYNITNISDSDYSVVSTDDFVILSSTITANRTITLPSAGSNTGRIIHLINLEMNGTFGYSPSPALLNNSNTLATGLGNNTATTIYSDGTNWRILHSTTN